MTERDLTYLALGDSYTIGESLPLLDTFPCQVVQALRSRGVSFHAPEIIAKTGWTSEELLEKMNNIQLQPFYDFVTLLIGVNDQYRGRDPQYYAKDLSLLLNKAIALAADQPANVVVMSIPDWGCSPFAPEDQKPVIASAIDHFNAINRSLAEQRGVNYLDITSMVRERAGESGQYAADRLHFTAPVYREWADLVSATFLQLILNQYAEG